MNPIILDVVEGEPLPPTVWRMAVRAVPIFADGDNPVPEGVDAWVYVHDDDGRRVPLLHHIFGSEVKISTPVLTLPDHAEPGMYAIVGYPVKEDS